MLLERQSIPSFAVLGELGSSQISVNQLNVKTAESFWENSGGSRGILVKGKIGVKIIDEDRIEK